MDEGIDRWRQGLAQVTTSGGALPYNHLEAALIVSS